MGTEILLEWLDKKIDDTEKRIESRLDSIDSKVNDIVKFKTQILGGTAVFSVIFGIAIQIFIALIGK